MKEPRLRLAYEHSTDTNHDDLDGKRSDLFRMTFSGIIILYLTKLASVSNTIIVFDLLVLSSHLFW
jgi:hypothetical protein